MCFILTSIHSLALTISKSKSENEEMIDYIIEEARKCLTGKSNSTEAEITSANLWTYTKSRWPEYERNAKTSNQADVAEYLMRIINESQNIMKQVGANIQRRRSCSNKHCPADSWKDMYTEYVFNTSEIPSIPEISLQRIIDRHILPEEP